MEYIHSSVSPPPPLLDLSAKSAQHQPEQTQRSKPALPAETPHRPARCPAGARIRLKFWGQSRERCRWYPATRELHKQQQERGRGRTPRQGRGSAKRGTQAHRPKAKSIYSVLKAVSPSQMTTWAFASPGSSWISRDASCSRISGGSVGYAASWAAQIKSATANRRWGIAVRG